MNSKRLVLWIVVSVAALSLFFGGATLVFFRTFYPDPPVTQFPPAPDLKTAQEQDLAYLRHYLDLNRTFDSEARARFVEKLEIAEDRAGALTPAQFALAVAEMAALADNGHSHISFGRLARRSNHLPCRLHLFADGYHIIRARPACADLLGARVLAVDGQPIDAVAREMYRYAGGPRTHYDQFASPFFLESPELLHGAGLASGPDRVTLRARLRDGTERDVELIADAPNPDGPRVWGSEFLSPLPVEREADDWRPLIPDEETLPRFLRDRDRPFRSEYLEGEDLYYAQFRSNMDEDGFPLGDFLDHLRNDIHDQQPRYIALDLRYNQGGDLTKTADFMKELPFLAGSIKQVYALTSRWTFSAGIVSLALLKEHGGEKVTIVGEPVGDRLRFWAEGGSLSLPNSGLSVSYSTGLHDYSRPCSGEPGCFWPLYFHPTHLETLEPDELVPYAFNDYLSRRDPAMDHVLASARDKASE